MVFAGSGVEALDIMREDSFDVIVSDMRMPGMDGAKLLTWVMEQYPWTVRIVLSGQSDREMALKAARPTHQFLSKPCDPDLLKATVARACALREVVTNDAVRRVVAKIDTLPALPDLYFAVINEIQSDTSSAVSVGRIIAKDVGMTADVLKMVNSSFFGFARHISNPEEAVTLLGLDVIKGLILSAHLVKVYDKSAIRGFSLEALWRHCLSVGGLAKKLAAEVVRDRKTVDAAFIAGLLHDVGKLVIGANLSAEYNALLDTVRAENRLVWEVERDALGTSHAEVGAYLLGLWGLPDVMVEALVFHHQPSASLSGRFNPLTAVHAADCLERELFKTNAHYATPQLDMDYLATLGLTDRLPCWRSIGLEHLNQDGSDEG